MQTSFVSLSVSLFLPLSLLPSLFIVICLILMSCFLLMPSFSSPFLSFLSSRSFCLSVKAFLFILWYFCYQFHSQTEMYTLSWGIYQSSGGFSPLHTIYELFLFFLSLCELKYWFCVVQWMERDTNMNSSFHCLTKQAEQVICACGAHTHGMMPTGYLWPFHCCFSWFSENVLLPTWQNIIFSVSWGSILTWFTYCLCVSTWSSAPFDLSQENRMLLWM